LKPAPFGVMFAPDPREQQLNSRQTTEPGRERLQTVATDVVFREVNSRIVELGERFGFRDETLLELLCECGDCSCTERVEIERNVYEQVRRVLGRRVVGPSHARTARAVSAGGSYVVVDD
jgi:hypothetical protein